jgi:hypothetical protein
MDGDSDLSDYDGRKYPQCKPYYGRKGQAWNTFVRDFSSAMALYDVWPTTRSRTACLASTPVVSSD